MAYIGKQPVVGNFQVCDAISVVNGQAAYTMQVGSANVTPESANHMLVSLNGILQKPGSSFTIAGATITFASNLATGDVIDFIILLGNVLDIGTPSDDSVGAAQIKDDLISGTTALSSEPADTDEFLVSDAGTLKRIDYSLIKGGGITQADQWRITANHTSNGTISSNWERVDSSGFGYIGTGMSESSGVFTFPSTGFYAIRFTCQGLAVNDSDNINGFIQVTVNDADYASVARANFSSTAGEFNASSTEYIFDVTSVSTHKARMRVDSIDSGSYAAGSTSESYTYVTFVRLGDT